MEKKGELAPKSLVDVANLSHRFDGEEPIQFPNFTCFQGEHMMISGLSGSGKSTLLYLIAGMLKIQQGRIEVLGQEIGEFSRKKMDQFRGENIGIVFQKARFISSLSVLENVISGQYFAGKSISTESAETLLESLGLVKLKSKNPRDLSGGERQRLSVARALASQPKILLADEPTSSLDDENAEKVYNLLVNEANAHGATLILVSHDQRIRHHFQNVVAI